MDAAARLEHRFGLASYRVPPGASEEFLAAAGEAAEILDRHALEWSLWRHSENPEEWGEVGPRFRERAELERAAAALQENRVLETLAAFEIDLSDGTGAVFQMVS